ncbi:protein ANTAGONIST OF LIKE HETEROCHROMATIN PROTEIN 1-like isoform X1 [Photinus pyralis]|uniref:protein ANTAGONIST OF LIKE HETEROCHROMATIN PROTEIN 1-like isoform X1 n=1 Tax=Photinus pyralis TaxID=7054 RepID=UPI001266E93F|nr:protein ANTAGONIST OF LIKE HETEROCHROMATIN PROTEIN 1-like isoform X1 [Photinus pyralis]
MSDVEVKALLLGSIATLLSIKLKLKSTKKTRKRKRFGIHPMLLQRKSQGFYDNLINEIRIHDPYMFFNFTRMSSSSFDKLLSLVGPDIAKKSLRESISPGCRLAITLRFLATGDSYPSLSYSFRVAVPTICNIIRETCLVLWNVLFPIVLKTPNEEMLKKFEKEFCTKWSLPNCVGAIDGKHVTIQAPYKSGSTFFNYKKNFSIVLLGVCNADYMFTYVDIGAYGSQSDGGVLNQSQFGQKLSTNSLNLPSPKLLPVSSNGLQIPHFFVGDEAFPLRSNLMRPYSKGRNGTMPEDEKIFNYRLSRARRIIENVFGILVARFRIFHRTINAFPETVDNIVKACVCLHNYIRMENNECYFQNEDIDREVDGKLISGRWRTEAPVDGALTNLRLRLGARNSGETALAMRTYLKEYFNGSGASLAPWQWNVINKTN